jgi:hypothetical protein
VTYTRPPSWAAALERAVSWIMLHWILGHICAVFVAGWIFYAFRHGFGVRPIQSKSKSSVGPTTKDKWPVSGRWSESGHFF